MQRGAHRSLNLVLPVPSAEATNRFEFRIYNALLRHLEANDLGFPVLDAEQSGKSMLRDMSKALQCLLPFDDAEPSPLRVRSRAHTRIPDRFRSEALGVAHSTNHHGEKKTVERLSASLLRVHANRLSQFADGPPWSVQTRWKGFMADLSSLASEMDKLGELLEQAATRKSAERQREEPARATDREEDVEGSGLREQCDSGVWFMPTNV